MWEDFDGWMRAYMDSIPRLADHFIQEPENGKILGIVPFLGVLRAMLFRSNSLRPVKADQKALP